MKRLAIFFMTLFLTLFFLTNAYSSDKTHTTKKAIVLAAFGTSYPQALKSITNLQEKIEKAFPNTLVKLAFTSQIIRKKWAKRASDQKWQSQYPNIDKQLYSVKSPLATIADLRDQGYEYIAVQSTHVFAGEEYHNLKNEVETLASIKALRQRDKPFKKLFLGRPALGEPSDIHIYHEDIINAAKTLKKDVELAKKNSSALVYMGHGNEIFSTGAYVETEAAMREMYPDVPIFIGAVEGFPNIDYVIQGLQHSKIKNVTLIPFMVVAGDHATNDMAGSEEDSWKSLIESKGIKVKQALLRGLGELDSWADIYVEHLQEAMKDNNF